MPIVLNPNPSNHQAPSRGRVYRRGSAKIWTIDFRANGKRFVRSSGSTNRADAERLLAKMVAERDQQTMLRRRRRAVDETRDAFLSLDRNSIIEVLVFSLQAFVQQCRARKQAVPGVYFLRSGEFIKIGYAIDLDNRKAELQIGNPHELEVAAFLPGPPALERKLHRMFRQYRQRSEWFRLAGDLAVFLEHWHQSWVPKEGLWKVDSPTDSDAGGPPPAKLGFINGSSGSA